MIQSHAGCPGRRAHGRKPLACAHLASPSPTLTPPWRPLRKPKEKRSRLHRHGFAQEGKTFQSAPPLLDLDVNFRIRTWVILCS